MTSLFLLIKGRSILASVIGFSATINYLVNTKSGLLLFFLTEVFLDKFFYQFYYTIDSRNNFFDFV